jgi:hypothetical protein
MNKKAAELEIEFHRYYTAHQNGNLDEAEQGYWSILKVKPDWAKVLGLLGNLYLDQDRPGNRSAACWL